MYKAIKMRLCIRLYRLMLKQSETFQQEGVRKHVGVVNIPAGLQPWQRKHI